MEKSQGLLGGREGTEVKSGVVGSFFLGITSGMG